MQDQQQQYINSILVIGASGRTGIQIMKHLASHPNRPRVHAFCRSPTKLAEAKKDRIFHSIIKGDATDPQDLERAIQSTHAQCVVVAVGNGDNLGKTDIRTTSALALAQVLQKPQFEHIKTLVVSSNGTAPSKIRIGMGMGKLIQYHLRHVLKDHQGQEAAFVPILGRTLIVRPTALTDGKHNPELVEFGDVERAPTIHIDRSDVAHYVAKQILGHTSEGDPFSGGRVINLTAAKKSRKQ